MFLEFDRRHGTVEKYDRQGCHQGEVTIDGKQLKPANLIFRQPLDSLN
jgi:hypothetical protein